jgi:hypothetical protein
MTNWRCWMFRFYWLQKSPADLFFIMKWGRPAVNNFDLSIGCANCHMVFRRQLTSLKRHLAATLEHCPTCNVFADVFIDVDTDAIPFWFQKLTAWRRLLRYWPFSLPEIGSPLQRWWRCHVGCNAITGSTGVCQYLAGKMAPIPKLFPTSGHLRNQSDVNSFPVNMSPVRTALRMCSA